MEKNQGDKIEKNITNWLDPRMRDHMSKGLLVRIAIRENQTDGKFIEGIVKEVLSEEDFEQKGIEVELENGYIGRVKEIVPTETGIISEDELMQKIKNHETKTFEMKSSFSFDVNLSKQLKKPIAGEYLERKIAEEAASFMNTEGGMICIGVDNNGNILGLDDDLNLLPSQERNFDKLRSNIRGKIFHYTKNDIIHDLVTIHIVELKKLKKQVCLIQVKPSPKPIFVKMKISYRMDNRDSSTELWRCYVRTEHGIEPINFDVFMEIWDSKKHPKSV